MTASFRVVHLFSCLATPASTPRTEFLSSIVTHRLASHCLTLQLPKLVSVPELQSSPYPSAVLRSSSLTSMTPVEIQYLRQLASTIQQNAMGLEAEFTAMKIIENDASCLDK